MSTFIFGTLSSLFNGNTLVLQILDVGPETKPFYTVVFLFLLKGAVCKKSSFLSLKLVKN